MNWFTSLSLSNDNANIKELLCVGSERSLLEEQTYSCPRLVPPATNARKILEPVS